MLDRDIKNLAQENLLEEVKNLKDQGYRLVTLSAVESDNHLEIIYHFDKNFQTINFRILFPKEEPIQSISKIYFCAFLIENEIQDHFGVKFKDLVLSFEGHLYLDQKTNLRAPYCSMTIKQEDNGGTN
ncbi:NADH-quinone oxidoreductase subunit C [Desulfonauticus submarinus]